MALALLTLTFAKLDQILVSIVDDYAVVAVLAAEIKETINATCLTLYIIHTCIGHLPVLLF